MFATATEDILLYASSFLSYEDAVGHGISNVNKSISAIFKNSPKIIRRRIKLQKRVIDTYLYHYKHGYKFNYTGDNGNYMYWEHTKLPKIENYLNIPQWIIVGLDEKYLDPLVHAQKRIRNELMSLKKFGIEE